MSLAWYVVQVATNMEDKVQGSLTLNIIKRINDYEYAGQADKANQVREAFGIDANLANDAEIDDFLKKTLFWYQKKRLKKFATVKNVKMIVRSSPAMF